MKKHMLFIFMISFFIGWGESDQAFATLSVEEKSVTAPFDAPQDLPLQIDAQNGIVCEREKNICTASGHVVAEHGEYILTCDTLVAHFRKKSEDKTELWQLEAKGNVFLHSKKGHHKAYGQYGVYRLDNEQATLTGNNLKLEIDDLKVTARDVLEYSKKQNIALAKGNAAAVKGDRLIKGETLKAYFETKEKGGYAIHRIEAFKDVLISTSQEIITGDYGNYLKDKEFATLEGDVKISRDDGQMEGEYAEVKLDTGISKMLNQSPTSITQSSPANRRVHVLILPRPKKAV